MRRIYKISLDIIVIILFISFFVCISYIKYLNNVNKNGSLVLVEDGLSINFLNGNKIDTKGSQKKYTISVTNNSQEKIYYYIKTTKIDCNKKDIKYTLVEKNDKLKIEETEYPLFDSFLASFIEIEPQKTHTFELTILENAYSYLKAEINVGLEDIQEENFASKLLAKNEIKKGPMTEIGISAATEKEGLIEINDDNGISYYFRGNISNNYVLFANLIWRIVKINGDGSIKLIFNDYIEDLGNYYNKEDEKNINDKINFANSSVNNILNNWYQENLNGYEKNIATFKYCVDDSVSQIEGSKTYYLGFSRLLVDHNQISGCLGSKFNSRIGLITADEAVYAGATNNSENNSFYLFTPNKDQAWWTMTPVSSEGNDIIYFEIDTKGSLKAETIGSYFRGLKPVINLVKNTYVSGEGTLEDPFIIKE